MSNEKSGKQEKLKRAKMSRAAELDFGHRLEAARANVQAYATAALFHSRPLNIRPELPLRLALGETHIVAAHRPLATYFTFRHNFTLPDARFGSVQIKGDRSVAANFNVVKNNPLL